MQLAPALDDDSAASARVAWLKAQGTPSHPPLQPRPAAGATQLAPGPVDMRIHSLSNNRYAVGRQTDWQIP